MSRYDVITIGTALQDIVFSTDLVETIRNPKPDPTKLRLMAFESGAKIRSDNVQMLFGGGAANTAVTFARLGVRVAVVARVGKDGAGEHIRRQLQAEGVATTHLQPDAQQATGFSFVLMEAHTNEHVAFAHYGANTKLDISTGQLNRLATQWFYISSLSQRNWPQTLRAVQRRAAKIGAAIAWNPGATQLAAAPALLKRFIKRTTVLILNRDEATELALRLHLLRKQVSKKAWRPSCPVLARTLATLGCLTIVITDGRHGAHVWSAGKIYFDKPGRTKPKDTTGAGDAFGSTFVAGLFLRPTDIPFALRAATVNATAQVAVVGAQTGLLTRPQILRRLRK